MVSNKFWKSLPEDLQELMVQCWDETVDPQREIAVKMQTEAQAAMAARGVKVYTPSGEQLAKWRAHMMPNQAGFVKKVKMDAELVRLAREKLGM